ncbi:hypothetical protein BpHYR1_026812 [Brachionus plicatilis]|uniref:Uncharacterized protein n=1 Tax=Brachionus plicatilis TaxID=10195 RepID=A0A3M7QCD5_BRAPC|nr:hypothetical protein BpHYR1_026812 [Brachionus plicatilis]
MFYRRFFNIKLLIRSGPQWVASRTECLGLVSCSCFFLILTKRNIFCVFTPFDFSITTSNNNNMLTHRIFRNRTNILAIV